MRDSRPWVSVITFCLCTIAGASLSHGAIGPASGGRVSLPAPRRIPTLTPTQLTDPFSASLSSAVFDGLYEINRNGSIVPVLAATMPQVDPQDPHVWRVPLRRGIRDHRGRTVTASRVRDALLRAQRSSRVRWLLHPMMDENGSLQIRTLDDHTLEFVRKDLTIDLVHCLSSPQLALQLDARHPIGTGPFRLQRLRDGRIRLTAFLESPRGAPWLERIDFRPPFARTEEIRRFELGQLDGSWQGRSLYDGRPLRAIESAHANGPPLILIRNRGARLQHANAWRGLRRAISRERLQRHGITPATQLHPQLPPPRVSRDAHRPPGTLRLLVARDDPWMIDVAETLESILSDRRISIQTIRATATQMNRHLSRDDWDLRLQLVEAPASTPAALVGAALAEIGAHEQAEEMACRWDDLARAQRLARSLDIIVLGRRAITLHHRQDLENIRFQPDGRLPLEDIHFARTTEAFR